MQLFGGELDKIRLQKLLFLLGRMQQEPVYDFVPYKFGCYSFSANADLTAMVKHEQLIETEHSFQLKIQDNYTALLKDRDRNLLSLTKRLYGEMNAEALMKHTYIKYPYWAVNSIKAEELLDNEGYCKVKNQLVLKEQTVLFTIGYEGLSVEEYFNRLLQNGIVLLIDVRNNPLSMKYGFSKSQLSRFCSNLGIKYLHLPEVGIESAKRRELNTQKDYDELFEDYRLHNLTHTIKTQQEILQYLQMHKRIAITCFEANICQCHRLHLAQAVAALPGFEYEIKHI